VAIDDSIGALADALARAGVDPPTPPREPPDLDAVDADLAPMSIPADVRRWWETVDPRSVRAWVFPDLIGSEFALRGWKQHRDEFPGMAPLALFDVGYASHVCMSVELDSPFGPGGTLFEWGLVDGGFHLRHHDLAGWLDRITRLVVAGEFERREGPEMGPRLLLRDPERGLPMTQQPSPRTPNPVHGDVKRYEREPLAWPVHWQRLSGIEPEEVKPRGATHTIAELMSSDPTRPLEATIAALVIDLASWSGNTRVRVSDDTGVMAINCPDAVTALGPVMRREFEFDVVVPAGEREAPTDLNALELDDPVEDLSQRLMARYGGPATAVATAIRPLGLAERLAHR
jgi:hypothetical protein